MTGGDDADGDIAHAGQGVLIGDFRLAENFDLLWVDAAFGQRLTEGCRLRAAGDHDEDPLRIEILGTLDVSGEVRALHRHVHRSDNVPASLLKAFLKGS